MGDQIYRLVSLIVATGIFAAIHRAVFKHLKEGPETKVVLSLDCIVVLTLVRAVVRNEIVETASSSTTQPHASLMDNFLYVFGAFSASLFIYMVFAWGRK